jgi:hypothetical protein
VGSAYLPGCALLNLSPSNTKPCTNFYRHPRTSLGFYSALVTAWTVWKKLTSIRKLKIREALMLWTIFVILLIMWLLGFSFHVAGSLIHLLLVIAVVVLLINLLTGRRTAL